MARLWRVDRIHSHLMGQALAGLSLSDLPLLEGESRESAIWAELVFTAICHQTNWDRLHNAILGLAKGNPAAISPVRLARIDGSDFLATFGSGIDPERLRLKERTSLLRDLGEKLLNWPDKTVAPWLSTAEVNLAGECGLYVWLSRLAAFGQDPLEKKARVFIHQLLKRSLIEVADVNHIAPAIDYHLCRYYVRTGRVLPLSDDVAKMLLPDQLARVEFHTHLRRAVEEAMFYSASGAGIRMDVLNHFEWQIARSFCTRQEARCERGPVEDKEIDLTLRVLHERSGQCPMVVDCRGAKDQELRHLVDPRSARAYY